MRHQVKFMRKIFMLRPLILSPVPKTRKTQTDSDTAFPHID